MCLDMHSPTARHRNLAACQHDALISISNLRVLRPLVHHCRARCRSHCRDHHKFLWHLGSVGPPHHNRAQAVALIPYPSPSGSYTVHMFRHQAPTERLGLSSNIDFNAAHPDNRRWSNPRHTTMMTRSRYAVLATATISVMITWQTLNPTNRHTR